MSAIKTHITLPPFKCFLYISKSTFDEFSCDVYKQNNIFLLWTFSLVTMSAPLCFIEDFSLFKAMKARKAKQNMLLIGLTFLKYVKKTAFCVQSDCRAKGGETDKSN